MTFLLIIACICAFLALVLLTKVQFILHYEDYLTINMKIWFIKIKLVPKLEKVKGKKKKKLEKASKIAEKDTDSALKKMIQKKGIGGALELFHDLMSGILEVLKKYFPHVMVTKLDIQMKVADEDAAKTAILYGTVCSVVYPAVAAICRTLIVKNYHLDITADYTDHTSYVNAHSALYIRVYHLISAGGYYLVRYIKTRKLDTTTQS